MSGFRVSTYTPYRSELVNSYKALNEVHPEFDNEDYNDLEVRHKLTVPGSYTGAYIYVDKIQGKEAYFDNLKVSSLSFSNNFNTFIPNGSFNNILSDNARFKYIIVETTGYFDTIEVNDINISKNLQVKENSTIEGLLYVPNSGSFNGIYIKDNATIENTLNSTNIKSTSIESSSIEATNIDTINIESVNSIFENSNINNATINELNLKNLIVNGSITLKSNDAYKMSSQFWHILSDKKSKTDIEDIKDEDKRLLLKLVNDMRLRTYRYKSNITNNTNKQIGIIADEIEEINPNLISVKDGYKHVDLSSLIYGLVLKVQELQKEIINLKERNNFLFLSGK